MNVMYCKKEKVVEKGELSHNEECLDSEKSQILSRFVRNVLTYLQSYIVDPAVNVSAACFDVVEIIVYQELIHPSIVSYEITKYFFLSHIYFFHIKIKEYC